MVKKNKSTQNKTQFQNKFFHLTNTLLTKNNSLTDKKIS